jgi:hypothetical protein
MPFDIVALAKRIAQRIAELDEMDGKRVRISAAMSRILENDPDYLPYRRRVPDKRQRPVTNPSVRTLAAIADVLGTTVGDLLGEPWPLSPSERAMLAKTVYVIRQLIDPDRR